MRTPYEPRHRRRILCISPRYAPSFGTFHYSYPLFGGRIRAFMPPQGLLVVAAYLPESWEARFVDENSRPATAPELAWADTLFLSGTHSTAQDARAGPRRARRPRRGRGARHLLRGRQLHREPEGGAGAAPPPGGMAAASTVPGALRLRGDAQHRQERARPRPHARCRL